MRFGLKGGLCYDFSLDKVCCFVGACIGFASVTFVWRYVLIHSLPRIGCEKSGVLYDKLAFRV